MHKGFKGFSKNTVPGKTGLTVVPTFQCCDGKYKDYCMLKTSTKQGTFCK